MINEDFQHGEHIESGLIKGLCEGDRKVFETIFRTYYSPLCRYALQYVQDPADAEETVQDMFCKIWIKRSDLDISMSLKAYLFKATRNHCLNFLHHRKIQMKYVQYLGFQVKDSVGSHSDGLEQKEIQRCLANALQQLPEKRREIFEMSRFQGLRYNQIADQLNISPKTVEAQISKTLDFLRVTLKEYLPVILPWLLMALVIY